MIEKEEKNKEKRDERLKKYWELFAEKNKQRSEITNQGKED